MPNLILDSLEIQNYRGLEELRIKRLGRVNLIVGKNNVGKTSVLEALRLYASPGSPEVLLDLLESRDQFDPSATLAYGKARGFGEAYQRLFFMHGREVFRPGTVIKIGKIDLPEGSLSISTQTGKSSAFHIIFTTSDQRILTAKLRPDAPGGQIFRETKRPADLKDSAPAKPMSHVGAGGLSTLQIDALWNKIALTSLEDNVLEALRLIARDVERLVLKPIDEGAYVRVPFVRLTGVNDPVSLRSLGDGMNRVFGIALALVNAKDGLLLIDEVENGLHYSVQPAIWRLIFQSASRLNVQVFATTHSLDCIKAFDVAARESEEEGVLIRLAQKAGRTLVGEFDELDLKIAVEGQIEVR